jgi:hypothetical protein
MGLKNYLGQISLYAGLGAAMLSNVRGAETYKAVDYDLEAKIEELAPGRGAELAPKWQQKRDNFYNSNYQYSTTINDPKKIRAMNIDDKIVYQLTIESQDTKIDAKDVYRAIRFDARPNNIIGYIGDIATELPNTLTEKINYKPEDQIHTVFIGDCNSTELEGPESWYQYGMLNWPVPHEFIGKVNGNSNTRLSERGFLYVESRKIVKNTDGTRACGKGFDLDPIVPGSNSLLLGFDMEDYIEQVAHPLVGD